MHETSICCCNAGQPSSMRARSNTPWHVDDHVTMLDLRKLGRTKRQLIVDKGAFGL